MTGSDIRYSSQFFFHCFLHFLRKTSFRDIVPSLSAFNRFSLCGYEQRFMNLPEKRPVSGQGQSSSSPGLIQAVTFQQL